MSTTANIVARPFAALIAKDNGRFVGCEVPHIMNRMWGMLLEDYSARPVTHTMRKFSHYRTAEQENDAYELWRERRDREPKRQKVEEQENRRPCPACASQGW